MKCDAHRLIGFNSVQTGLKYSQTWYSSYYVTSICWAWRFIKLRELREPPQGTDKTGQSQPWKAIQTFKDSSEAAAPRVTGSGLQNKVQQIFGFCLALCFFSFKKCNHSDLCLNTSQWSASKRFRLLWLLIYSALFCFFPKYGKS